MGRLEYSLLSDQALTEMLIEGFDERNKERYQDEHGMYLDVCEWSCIECNDDNRVTEIGIFGGHVRGSLDLCYVPPKVKVLNITSWFKSQLTGSVDLTQLPVGMQRLSLSNTELEGKIDLSHLPHEMEFISLEDNHLAGEIDLTHLPEGMSRLFLPNNQFRGEIDLAHLPCVMAFIFLANNQLSGSLVINTLPPLMDTINVQGNHFNCVAVIHSRVVSHIFLRGSGVKSVVDESGEEIDIQRFLK